MLYSFLLVITLCFGQISSKVIETYTIEEVIPLIDEDTWLLVDLDNCLFESAQALGHADWFYDEVLQRMQRGMNKEEAIKDFYPQWIKIQKICSVKPIEDAFISYILMLQNKGIVIMGLTHRQPRVASATCNQVKSLNFDFSKTAPIQENSTEQYSEGILFVGDNNRKIDIFLPFINNVKQKPKKVVFIDDKKKNVEELELLHHYGIDYIGVHYRAIERTKPIYIRSIAEFQLNYVDRILSNEAALKLMEESLE